VLSLIRSSYYSEDRDFEVESSYPELRLHLLTYLQEDAATANATGTATDLRAANGSNVRVKFILRTGQDWVDMAELSIDPADLLSSTAVERVAEVYTSKRRFLFDIALRSLALSEYLDAVVSNGTNVVLLIPEGSINIDYILLISTQIFGINAPRVAGNAIG